MAGTPTSPTAVSSHMMWMILGGAPNFFRSSSVQLAVQVLVLGRPPLAVQRFEDVEFRVVNDLGLARCATAVWLTAEQGVTRAMAAHAAPIRARLVALWPFLVSCVIDLDSFVHRRQLAGTERNYVPGCESQPPRHGTLG